MLQTLRLFTSSGYIETGALTSGSGQTLDFNHLPPFLRTLLTTDGTVTKSLESFFWEPVKVENLGQQRTTLTTDEALINRKAGQQVLRRNIQLRGSNSKKIYAKASSLICIEMLEPEIAWSLEEGKMGIGELLRECGLETYREILDVGEIGGDKNHTSCDREIWRTYRIVMEHQPVIQVTETFPLAVFI